MKLFSRRYIRLLAPLAVGGAVVAAVACGSDTVTTVVETVVVEKEVQVQVPGEKVVETVVVEKEVAVPGEKVVETVIVEKEKVVTEEKTVVQTVVVEKDVPVEVVVTATATAIPTVAGISPVSPPNPQSGAGAAVIAINAVGDENGFNQAQSSDSLKNWGIAETLFLRDPVTDSALPWIGKSWEIIGGGASATVDIDTRAEFRFINDSGAIEKFGNITAEDVAWSMNNANALTNPESIHGQAGDFAGLFSEWKVVDADTVSFDFISFDSTWNVDYTNESGQALSFFSKKVFDDKGADFVRDNIVATGPYLVEEWLRDDKFTIVSAESAGAGAHYKFSPKTDRITFLEVPEPTTRAALLKTGEADIAAIEPKDVPQFSQGGFLTTSAGGSVQLGVFFSGNLWETVSAKDGSPLTRGTFVHDLAWIGNPNDEQDLQEAKSVRNALARSVDREAINDSLLSGLGQRVDVEYVSSTHARFQKDKWTYQYDPDLAIEILRGENSKWPVDGSFRKDEVSKSQKAALNGNAFSVSIYAGPELGGGTAVTGEVTDAVAGFWADLGLTVFTLKFSYVTFRPTVVGRTNVHPWITSCDKGRESNPWHFPKGLVQTSLTRGGFGCGFEIPFILDNYQKVAVEPDEEVRNQLVDEYVDYVYDQALQPGVVAVPALFVMNPNKVKGWDMGKLAAGNLGRTWQLELK